MKSVTPNIQEWNAKREKQSEARKKYWAERKARGKTVRWDINYNLINNYSFGDKCVTTEDTKGNKEFSLSQKKANTPDADTSVDTSEAKPVKVTKNSPFCLSDRIHLCPLCNELICGGTKIQTKDVKEFIKILKEKNTDCYERCVYLTDSDIDKLAGKSLC